jgi:hypothetical protein
MEDPNVVTVFEDYFADMAYWTPIGPLGLENWSVVQTANAGGVLPELRFNYSPSFTGESYLLSAPISLVAGHNHQLTFKHYLDWFANPSGIIGCAITYDGGTTFIPLWSVVDPTGNIGPETVTADFAALAGESMAQLAFFYNGYSFNIDYWYIDDVVLKDLEGGVVPPYIIVTAPARNAQWQAGQYYDIMWDDNLTENVAILLYDGPTRVKTIARDTESDGVYNWRVTRTLIPGTNYKILIRSKLDPTIKGWSGKFAITPMAEALLSNNYPNPFNPSTVIKYSIPFDGNVKLTVYNSLGQQVAELVNSQQATGSYEVTFDASSLSSGIYFYQINASSGTGENFNSVQKMLYLK